MTAGAVMAHQNKEKEIKDEANSHDHWQLVPPKPSNTQHVFSQRKNLKLKTRLKFKVCVWIEIEEKKYIYHLSKHV